MSRNAGDYPATEAKNSLLSDENLVRVTIRFRFEFAVARCGYLFSDSLV